MNTKKYLFSLFVLVSALPGYPEESSDTNLVEVVNFDDLAKFFSDLSSVVSNLQDVVYQTSVSGAVTSSNLISDVSSKLTALQTALTAASGKPSNINTPSIQIRNGNASVVTTSWQWRDIGFAFNNITSGMQNMMQYFAYFVSGGNSIQNYGKYNFSRLYDIIDSFCNNVLPLITSIDNHLNDIEPDVDSINSNVEVIKNLLSDLSSILGYLNDLYYFLTAQLADMLGTMQAGTNQLQTIIYIVEELTNRVDQAQTNYLSDITNILSSIASDLENVYDKIDSGDGDTPGGGGSGSVDLSYFDRWLKEWVEHYFYPEDSSFSLEYRYGVLQDNFPNIGGLRFSFLVPYLGLGLSAHPEWSSEYPNVADLDNPAWWSAFQNTLYAYNNGHTNYYDVVSALLTDIQSVNAQNYALFYVLATNILLSGQNEDMSEVSNQFSQIDRIAEQITNFTNQLGAVVSQNVAVVENKFQVFADNCKQITDYLATIPQLPQQDYFVDLPTWEIFGQEYGGMEITLKLTDDSFIVVLEILHAFFLLMWWVTVLGVFFLVGRLCYKMFFALYKTFLFTSFMATE